MPTAPVVLTIASGGVLTRYVLRPPSPAEDAKRIVRHGLADVLAWLGQEVGPKPGYPWEVSTSPTNTTWTATVAR